MTRECAKKDVLFCKHTLTICSTCKCVIKYMFCKNTLPYVPCKKVPKDIVYCTHTLPLYFTCKCSIRRIMSFTHALRLYSIQRTLLNSKTIWWYWCRAVCARIWYCAIFCEIQNISDRYLRIAYGKDSSTTSSTSTKTTIYTLISASL